MMSLLFEIQHSSDADLPGLSYFPNYIGEYEQAALITKIDQEPWLSDLKRRVQHYGYKYDYKARVVRNDAHLGPLPDWLAPYCAKLVEEDYFSTTPDQVIINEYLPGQGISSHIDCVPCFGDTIAVLSLGSSCVMRFSNPQTSKIQDMFLKERCLIVLSGDARYRWRHAIPSRKTDHVNGSKIQRERRISLTFRSVILD